MKRRKLLPGNPKKGAAGFLFGRSGMRENDPHREGARREGVGPEGMVDPELAARDAEVREQSERDLALRRVTGVLGEGDALAGSPGEGVDAGLEAPGQRAALSRVDQATLNRAATELDENGKKALMAGYDGRVPTEEYVRAFSHFYHAGQTGIPAERIDTTEGSYGAMLSPEKRMTAWFAGQNDAQAGQAGGPEVEAADAMDAREMQPAAEPEMIDDEGDLGYNGDQEASLESDEGEVIKGSGEIVRPGDPEFLGPLTKSDQHFIYGDGIGPKKRGVLGAHSLDNFNSTLESTGFPLDDLKVGEPVPHPTIDGVYAQYYRLPAYDGRGNFIGFKDIPDPKTYFDADIISNSKMLELGKEAMSNAKPVGNGDVIVGGTASNGLEFRGYLRDGEITNFFPIIP